MKEKHAKYLPHSAGRYASKRFRKAQCPIVERLTNSMMMHGRNNGKKLLAVKIVKHSFEIIHLLTGEVSHLSLSKRFWPPCSYSSDHYIWPRASVLATPFHPAWWTKFV